MVRKAIKRHLKMVFSLSNSVELKPGPCFYVPSKQNGLVFIFLYYYPRVFFFFLIGYDCKPGVAKSNT